MSVLWTTPLIVKFFSQKDFDYYDRRGYEDPDLFERRFRGSSRSGDSFSRSRDLPPMPMPPSRSAAGRMDSMFSRRSPPPSRGGMRGFGVYEDFSRDSFDDRRPGMRGLSPTHRYAPY